MKKLLLITLVALTSACTTSADLGAGRTGKAINVSENSYDKVWTASLEAVKEAGGTQSLEIEKNLTVSKEDKAGGTILATTGMSLWSWGEVVGVFITPAKDAPEHKIEVESRAKMKTNITSNNWEDEIINRIKSKLAGAKIIPVTSSAPAKSTTTSTTTTTKSSTSTETKTPVKSSSADYPTSRR